MNYNTKRGQHLGRNMNGEPYRPNSRQQVIESLSRMTRSNENNYDNKNYSESEDEETMQANDSSKRTEFTCPIDSSSLDIKDVKRIFDQGMYTFKYLNHFGVIVLNTCMSYVFI
jgi:hypothetical protein